MGFAFLDRYDVETCASLCNTRPADPIGGMCQYFNIWRAVVNGTPTTYTCSMVCTILYAWAGYNLRITQYYLVANPSTAINTGQGSLEVTYARGYSRQPVNPDRDFSGPDSAWTTRSSSILHDPSLAHTGSHVGVLGTQTTPAPGSSLGIITLARPLKTHASRTYGLQFFASAQPTVSGTTLNGSTVSQVLWNNAVIAAIAPQSSDWEVYTVSVTGQGNDVLSFVQTDGAVYTLIDEVALFSLFIE